MTLEPVGSRYFLGLDLGQARDYSALAIAERRVERTGVKDPVTWLERTATRVIVSHLERFPLRLAYHDVVTRVAAIARSFKGQPFEVLLDSTGVGGVVREILRRAQIGCTIYGVTITGGERVTVVPGGYHVPRHDLLSNLRVLLEQRQLEIDVPPEIGRLLEQEFLRWGCRSAHDDLVFAVALACWKAGGQPLPSNSGPLPLIYPKIR